MDVKFTTNANIIKALEVFVAVLETGQMTAAARLVGMTQSAASQHISTLEKHYDVRLIERQSSIGLN